MIKITSFLGLSLIALASADAAAPPRLDIPTMATTADPTSEPPIIAIALRGFSGVPEDWPPMVAGTNTVPFAPGSAELLPEARTALDTLATSLIRRPDLAIELRGYAAAIDENQSQARRLSLARTIMVRAYLIADGVPKLRMIVRPLGDRTPADRPPDRVDLVASAR
jgi:outer membrane protein OmpA-like peptidoglycan-associated protein